MDAPVIRGATRMLQDYCEAYIQETRFASCMDVLRSSLVGQFDSVSATYVAQADAFSHTLSDLIKINPLSEVATLQMQQMALRLSHGAFDKEVSATIAAAQTLIVPIWDSAANAAVLSDMISDLAETLCSFIKDTQPRANVKHVRRVFRYIRKQFDRNDNHNSDGVRFLKPSWSDKAEEAYKMFVLLIAVLTLLSTEKSGQEVAYRLDTIIQPITTCDHKAIRDDLSGIISGTIDIMSTSLNTPLRPRHHHRQRLRHKKGLETYAGKILYTGTTRRYYSK